ncbi:unnamed protein product [Miscanthus lutarioriparius]|uniref:Uncharacterized protein n=1 Tax=Miscanthus lutarioriparius TaxID=422564 RepID=A0A811SI41_9POAL|nr:unnamed protein product [Miscanthus lutarioriparius]
MAAEAGSRRGAAARRKAKEAAVGAAARVLFYPTLLYNVVRSKVQAEFQWWDEVDQFVLLGAVPFRRDVTRLQKLGVKYKNMTPAAAFEHVRSKRARVLLTHSQWKAVQEFSKKNADLPAPTSDSATASPARDVVRFGKDDAVIQVRVNDPIAKRHSHTSDVASAPTDECTWSCSSESTSHLLSHYNLKLLLAEATMLNPTNGSNDVASCS